MGQYLEQNLKNQAQWMHLGIQDDFIPHGNNKILFELAGYGPEKLLKTLTAIHRDL